MSLKSEAKAPVWPSDIKISNATANSFTLSLNSNGNAYNVVVAKHKADSKGFVIMNPDSLDATDIFVKLENQTEQQIQIVVDSASGILLEVYVQAVNGAGAGGDAQADSPADSLGIVSVSRNIGEVHGIVHHRAAGCTPQEGDDLGAGAGSVGREGGVGGAAGDAPGGSLKIGRAHV